MGWFWLETYVDVVLPTVDDWFYDNYIIEFAVAERDLKTYLGADYETFISDWTWDDCVDLFQLASEWRIVER